EVDVGRVVESRAAFEGVIGPPRHVDSICRDMVLRDAGFIYRTIGHDAELRMIAMAYDDDLAVCIRQQVLEGQGDRNGGHGKHGLSTLYSSGGPPRQPIATPLNMVNEVLPFILNIPLN